VHDSRSAERAREAWRCTGASECARASEGACRAGSGRGSAQEQTRACPTSWRRAGVTQTRERHDWQCRSECEQRRAGGANMRAVTQRKPVACAGVERSARGGRWRRGWLGRGRSRPRWREHACASAEVTRQGRANTGLAAGSGGAAAQRAGRRCAGRSRAMREKLQSGGCRRTCPGSSRVVRGERRGSLRRKPRTKSSGTANYSWRTEVVWRGR
jgi:hypothetical protein